MKLIYKYIILVIFAIFVVGCNSHKVLKYELDMYSIDYSSDFPYDVDYANIKKLAREDFIDDLKDVAQDDTHISSIAKQMSPSITDKDMKIANMLKNSKSIIHIDNTTSTKGAREHNYYLRSRMDGEDKIIIKKTLLFEPYISYQVDRNLVISNTFMFAPLTSYPKDFSYDILRDASWKPGYLFPFAQYWKHAQYINKNGFFTEILALSAGILSIPIAWVPIPTLEFIFNTEETTPNVAISRNMPKEIVPIDDLNLISVTPYSDEMEECQEDYDRKTCDSIYVKMYSYLNKQKDAFSPANFGSNIKNYKLHHKEYKTILCKVLDLKSLDTTECNINERFTSMKVLYDKEIESLKKKGIKYYAK